MSIQDVKIYVGVDVASKHLDLFFPDTGKSERIKNEAEAIRAFCSGMKGKAEFMFVMEASGGYEAVFCAQLGDNSISYAVVNARLVREFASSLLAWALMQRQMQSMPK